MSLEQLGLDEGSERKAILDRRALMRSRLDGRGYGVEEGAVVYGMKSSDWDCDFDVEEGRVQPGGAQAGVPRGGSSTSPLLDARESSGT